LKVNSGKEAMELLIRSKRVRDDILVRVLKSDVKNPFQMIVAVRSWNEIIPGFEFRGFVYKKKLNALSQYFENIYIPELSNTKDSIKEQIFKVFEEIVKILLTYFTEKSD
jgi:hypothetical protein